MATAKQSHKSRHVYIHIGCILGRASDDLYSVFGDIALPSPDSGPFQAYMKINTLAQKTELGRDFTSQ